MKHRLATIAAAAGVALAASSSANAFVLQNGGNTINIPGLTGFATTGADMDGLAITAYFNGVAAPTLLWADIPGGSPNDGGVTGAFWSLSVDGDTFSANWNFTFAAGNQAQLTRLTLDGLNAFTVFDRTNPNQGTPGSAQGRDFVVTGGCAGCDGTVTYDFGVGIGGNAPVGDLFQTVDINFATAGANTGPRTNWSFGQDADNDIRQTQVAEPGSLALTGLALLGLAAFRRRRGRQA